jgi:hypothetical protein
VATRVRIPLGLLCDLDPLGRARRYESLVVSYLEVVHAQALREGVSTSGLRATAGR